MPLAKRIIPCLDVDRGRVQKGVHFRDLRDAGDPVDMARRYREEGADELVFLDITASVDRREILHQLVSRVAEHLDIPFTVGGGIRSLEDARLVLCSGADKVGINTAAVERPELISEIARLFGDQCVVVAIDAKRTGMTESGFEIFTHGGRRPAGRDALGWATKVQSLGAGEILLTSIDTDGTQRGYDLELTARVMNDATIPVIASGGCGRIEHFAEVFERTGADAALAASVFHYDTLKIARVKAYLQDRGISVRI